MDLGDARRDARVMRAVERLAANPAAAFPTAMRTVAEREGLYRLLNNPRVTMDALLAPHIARTVGRAREGAERPIVAVDKTFLVFSGEADRDGLERVGPNRQGFDAFFGLALSRERQPHGVLAALALEGHGRSNALAWSGFIESMMVTADAAKLDPIFVMDREADAFGLLAELTAHGRDFVVRVSASRKVQDDDLTEETIREVAARAPVTLTRSVRLARRGVGGRSTKERKKYPPRVTREAVLSVRACPVTLPKRRHVTSTDVDQLVLHLVQVIEEAPPADVAPVEWLLVTTLPIHDADGIGAIVDIYRARWTIEEFFKALKTGCSYEKRQLECRESLLNALGLLVPIAWKLLSLRCLADEDPDAPAHDILEADEIIVLRKLSVDVKLGPRPTAFDVVRALASLGGHFAQNGRPGWLVIWRGMQFFLDRLEGYRLAKAEM